MERSDNGNEQFKCTGKEQDAETDFNYFGARYYDAEVSVWLSVDPMADDYPALTPYSYSNNNPVIYLDPDGRLFVDYDQNGNKIGVSKNNWFHNLFVGRKGRILDDEGKKIQRFKFNDWKHDKEKILSGETGEMTVDNKFQNKVDDKITAGANEINDEIDWYKENDENFPIIKGVKSGVTSGLADFAADDNLKGENSTLFLIDGVAYNNYDAANFLTGASVKKANTKLVGQMIFRIGAHINNHKHSNAQNRHNPDYEKDNRLIRPDSRADQKAIRNGFRYQRKKNRI